MNKEPTHTDTHGCITLHDCHNDHCKYPEPHSHGFACDAGCTTCGGQGVPVKDPESHPKHVEWDHSRCNCLSAALALCPIHHHPNDMAAPIAT